MRILVVEDDPRMASLLSRALRESGYAVDVVSDGRGAVEQGVLGSHDLVVLDILLPGMNSRRLAELGRVATTRSHPVGALRDRRRVRGLNLGADDYLRSRSPSRLEAASQR
jgi:DNA-binding response OmpR family regulator